MAASEYRIRVKRGHHARLRFWFDPMSDDIWNGDADLIMEDELSCDNICTHELFFPIIERFFPGEFRWRNELNLMPMEDVKDMIDEIRDLIDIDCGCAVRESRYAMLGCLRLDDLKEFYVHG